MNVLEEQGILEWAEKVGLAVTRRHGFLTAKAQAGTPRYCRVHLQHRPHLSYVVPWFVIPVDIQLASSAATFYDQRFLWVCPNGRLNLEDALPEAIEGVRWSNYYAPGEKGMAVLVKNILAKSPRLAYPLTELEKPPWA